MTIAGYTAEELEGFRPFMTEVEYEAWRLPQEVVRAEWVDGQVILFEPATFEHSETAAFLLILMGLHAAKNELGNVGALQFMHRLKRSRRFPDIFFVAKGRESLIQRTSLDGPPDLIVEVVSPDSESRDWRDKYIEYQANGVREYWVVDPASQHAEFYTLKDNKYATMSVKDGIIRSTALPGFWLKTEWLWQRPLPKTNEIAKTLGII